MNKDIVWHEYHVNLEDRIKKNGHKPAVLWFTGLSGSGKSTIANAVTAELFEKNIQTFGLDGDNVRHGLNSDLSFSAKDRKENIRRVSELAKLFCESGHIVTTAFISPFIEDRNYARKIIGDSFIEVFIDTAFEVCAKRDPKGLYKKALKGEIKNFTGLDSPYEAPENPDILIKTETLSIEDACQKIEQHLKKNGILNA